MFRGFSLIVTSLLIIYLAFALNWFSPVQFLYYYLNGSQDNIVYGVVFDAGSTGSRARVYKVLQNASGRAMCSPPVVSCGLIRYNQQWWHVK